MPRSIFGFKKDDKTESALRLILLGLLYQDTEMRRDEGKWEMCI
jgi:hypothetical protein